MKSVNGLISLILLFVAVFSVTTSGPLLASTNDNGNEEQEGAEPESNDPEEEAEEAAEEGETTVYDDNPDLDGDGTVTEEENQKFTDPAVALGDKLNNPDEEQEEEEVLQTE
jgi:hypothetical protein